MRIIYLSSSYVPSRRASSVQVMKMCHAFGLNGHQVTLVTKYCPERQELGIKDDFQFYSVEPLFEVVKLPRPDRLGGEVHYSLGQLQLLRKERKEIDLVYSRDLFGAWIAAKLKYPTIFEAHILPAGRLSHSVHAQLFRTTAFQRLIVISAALQREFERSSLLPDSRLVRVAHDGADPLLGKLSPMELPEQLRSEKRPKIGYIGSLYAGKGVELIVELAQRLSECDFHIVGGTRRDLANWSNRQLPKNLTFHGFVPQEDLAPYYQQFDMLLMPYQRQVVGATGSTDIGAWMSPLKMFEYMATGIPIISSDLPVLREVLEHERNSLLVPPDDVNAWIEAIDRVLREPQLASRLGETAKAELLNRYTWESRARYVLDGL